MDVKQIWKLTNDVTKEVLGSEEVLNEDLSNVVDIGTEIFNARAFDNYVRTLVDHIGRVIFVNRPYSGSAPSVLMDGWEYGSVMQKVTSSEIPEAVENETWELTNGTSYDPNIFVKPKVSTKFFNNRTTFEVDRSITEKQVKSAFSSPEQLNGFVSMIFDTLDKSLTVKTDGLIMRTINNMIGETLKTDFANGNYGSNSTARCVNLLKLYNDKFGKALTPENVLYDGDFLRFASMTMGIYKTRLGGLSKIFNIGGLPRFTPTDRLHFVTLADFSSAADSYLYSDTWHNEYVALPNHETVPFWQGSGLEYSFGDISEINIKTASGANVHASGILGVMFDRDALGVCNYERRVTTNYNPKAEFTNYFYKQDAMYFNDTNENFVVFYVA